MSLFVGSISGTSIDGLDIALVEIDDSLLIKSSHTREFPNVLRNALINLTSPHENDVERASKVHRQLGTFIGESVLLFLQDEGIEKEDVIAIGSHGQTIRHAPDDEFPYSVQVGDGSCIAEVTGIDTIVDFRNRDIAAGGSGAPLAPIFHEVLFRDEKQNRIILNLGGIANITVIHAEPSQPILGFDTGPANVLMDAWTSSCLKKRYDENGEWAATGKISETLLHTMLNHQWFQRPMPKSTGRELFNIEFILQAVGVLNVKEEDVQATLCELSVQTIASAIRLVCKKPQEIVVCGGGRLNAYLMQRLQSSLSPAVVVACDELGVDGDGLEAAAFAYLAYLFIERRHGNLPSVTGARGARILGSLYPAN